MILDAPGSLPIHYDVSSWCKTQLFPCCDRTRVVVGAFPSSAAALCWLSPMGDMTSGRATVLVISSRIYGTGGRGGGAGNGVSLAVSLLASLLFCLGGAWAGDCLWIPSLKGIHFRFPILALPLLALRHTHKSPCNTGDSNSCKSLCI